MWWVGHLRLRLMTMMRLRLRMQSTALRSTWLMMAMVVPAVSISMESCSARLHCLRFRRRRLSVVSVARVTSTIAPSVRMKSLTNDSSESKHRLSYRSMASASRRHRYYSQAVMRMRRVMTSMESMKSVWQ